MSSAPSYRAFYDLAVAAWNQDWENSKVLSDKARTYLTVIGLVFGYSLFNLKPLVADAEGLSAAGASGLALLVKVLLVVYFFAFSIALVSTLMSLSVRNFSAMPRPEHFEAYAAGGPNPGDLEKGYHQLAEIITKAASENQALAGDQARWLKRSFRALLVGVCALSGAALILFMTVWPW